MVDFSDRRSSGSAAPARFEVDLRDCEVAGEIPKDLDGALYRLHMDWLYPPAYADETILAADGYISMFRFKRGRADYKGRYVQTLRYLKQIEAGRQLYGYYRNPYTDDPSVRNIANPGARTTANTTPVILGGKLYATKEDGLPYEIDPNTLATRGQTNFGDRWRSQTFTAHPKLDPETGETIAYGYEASGLCTRDVFVACFDREGNITREWSFQAPHTSELHDMWLTREHIVIPGGGLTTDLDRLRAGGLHWMWDSTKPSWHAVIPRDGGSEDIRFFFGPERSIVHTANARTEGSRIVLEGPVANGNTWPWFTNLDGRPYTPVPNTLRRITLDLRSERSEVLEEPLFETNITSFTRIDERFTTLPYRYIYVQYADSRFASGNLLGRTDGNCVGRFDLQTGMLQPYFPGPGRALQEPVFIPRSPHAAEGEGYVVAVGHNIAQSTTELYLLDALRMEELARVTLPFRTPPQVHGTWGDPTTLPLE
ncbi:MAG TPA: carotenoid oxygenase family protein [Steroidobacteraceae bacterium]|jgi:carotenoid cleavage dioxygenase-like enzyme|nr:carotenoid oxygenase family protein [Steroidobacteraceae bacterium]